jgi:hypothetical protein
MRYANHIFLSLVGALIVTCSAIAASPAITPNPDHQLASASDGAIAAQRAWWSAFVIADTQHPQNFTAPTFLLTPSSGKNHDRTAMLAEAATHTKGNEARIGNSVISAE